MCDEQPNVPARECYDTQSESMSLKQGCQVNGRCWPHAAQRRVQSP